MTVVEVLEMFTEDRAAYVPGDVAGFEPAVADRLVAEGKVKYAVEPEAVALGEPATEPEAPVAEAPAPEAV